MKSKTTDKPITHNRSWGGGGGKTAAAQKKSNENNDFWDKEEKKLYIIRDRFCVKPLVYYWNGSDFAFASQLKALMRLPIENTNRR